MGQQHTAIVTGGANGIGRACAEVLAEAGHPVVIVDLDADKTASVKRDLSMVAVACDMGDAEAVEETFARIPADHGPVGILVNNAGLAVPGDFLDFSLDDWRRTLDVNLTGAFVATQCIARSMVSTETKGAIVNMSSINAQVAIPSIPAYCASKGGLAQLTRAAALALAPHGIRVNAVAPGSIDTAMVAGVNDNPEAMGRLMSRTPLKRLGTPREIAEIVAFLASDRAGYITGETVVADGGRLALNYTC